MNDPANLTHRRAFLKRVAAAVGGMGVADLLAIDEAFGRELTTLLAPAPGSPHFEELRSRYTLDERIIYFNNASIGTIPRLVQEARAVYLKLCETNPWLYMWGGEWEEPREAVREKAGTYLGCSAGEVAFTHNTTEGFNVLAQGLDLRAGDEVLFSSLNHDGASVCWFHSAERRGFKVKRFDFPVLETPRLNEDEIIDIYDRQITANTRLLALPHIDNLIGLRHPVKKLTDMARSRGVEFIAIDGAQAVGMIDVDVTEIGADFYCASPHKWLQAPKGLGLMHIRQTTQERLRPMWVTWGQRRWAGTVRIFEDYGTRNLPELLALGDAIDFQIALGTAAKQARHRELWQRFRDRARLADGVTWRSPETWELSASLYALEIEGHDSKEVFEHMFGEHGFVFRAFSTPELNTVRISPNIYATDDEVDRFFGALAGLRAG